ncbi:hypothetical protein N7520_000632 [Penicillium odoratum]|uniref:uncharacterized protein n=1 Tax=Penicillium odoratum TaxID=1167516 RepID=UPI00254889D3|nr:uncharacterized protein N7520_000632 [Penicillium odoratum]KAJ5777386.1 hypothetical protein N7520_000632 [Penicillium odoratum]
MSGSDLVPGSAAMKVTTPDKRPNTLCREPKTERKPRGFFNRAARWLLHNQIYISFNLIAGLLCIHSFLPQVQQYTSKLFTISHYNERTGEYGVGSDDFLFLGFCVVLFTCLRASCMEYLLQPIARYCGASTKKDVIRFSEQAWLLCYYSVFWVLGVYIYVTSEYFLNPKEMFTNWPTRELPGLVKWYILSQWAFWIQQLLVINIEERRKDHWQMLTHHLLTIGLLYTSYTLHLTRVANLVLILMDVVDIFFPLAKCFKYLGLSTLRDIMFGVFMVSWFLARHVWYVTNMYHIWVYMPDTVKIGCYHTSENKLVTGPTPLPEKGWSHMFEAFINPSGTICYNDSIRWGFLASLGFLQIITIIWFFMIVKVAIRVVQGNGADDIRSDDEDEASEEEVEETGRGQTLAKVLEGSASADPKTLKRNAEAEGNAFSTGAGLSARWERKGLLGRVGCERQVD